MIKGLTHTAIVTGDLERSLAFYRDLLGFPVVRTMDLGGGARIVMLSVAGKGELEIFVRPRTRPLPEGYGEEERIGLWHLALEVDNVETEWARLEERGIRPLSAEQPLFRQPHGPRACHFLDPDGIVVEFIETPDKWWPKEVRPENLVQ